jgi:hypothetical protein
MPMAAAIAANAPGAVVRAPTVVHPPLLEEPEVSLLGPLFEVPLDEPPLAAPPPLAALPLLDPPVPLDPLPLLDDRPPLLDPELAPPSNATNVQVKFAHVAPCA